MQFTDRALQSPGFALDLELERGGVRLRRRAADVFLKLVGKRPQLADFGCERGIAERPGGKLVSRAREHEQLRFGRPFERGREQPLGHCLAAGPFGEERLVIEQFLGLLGHGDAEALLEE
jgi:hypothetical protein